jgi:HAE1 family hydrophobic/amphiphilic exporter-1
VDREIPEAVGSVVSVRDAETEITVNLVPVAERERSNLQIADEVRESLAGAVGGMEIRTRAPQGQFILNRILGVGDESLSIEIRGFDLEVLAKLGAETMAAIRGIPGITDVDVDLEEGTPQQEIRLDRDRIADLGLSVRDVAEVIRTSVAGSRAGEYRTQGDSYRILVQMEDAERMSIDDVLDLSVSAPDGAQVALRNVVTTELSRAPLTIRRKDQQRLARVSANVEGRDLGSVAEAVLAAIDRIPRPTGYDLSVAGSFEEQQESFRELILSLVLAMLLVYMVLACQYESLKDPLIVMLAVPMAAVGVLLTLFLTATTINLQSGLGCIMLVGIVVNNAILLVDQASRLQAEGLAVAAAVAEAGRRRLRPILMTTSTTVLGLMPLALGLGEGADAQAPLARAVIGGLVGATVITLVLVPVVYSLVHRGEAAAAPA